MYSLCFIKRYNNASCKDCFAVIISSCFFDTIAPPAFLLSVFWTHFFCHPWNCLQTRTRTAAKNRARQKYIQCVNRSTRAKVKALMSKTATKSYEWEIMQLFLCVCDYLEKNCFLFCSLHPFFLYSTHNLWACLVTANLWVENSLSLLIFYFFFSLSLSSRSKQQKLSLSSSEQVTKFYLSSPKGGVKKDVAKNSTIFWKVFFFVDGMSDTISVLSSSPPPH